MPFKKKYQEVTLEVTEDHFKRAIPGDVCHCTLGEAVHDALGTLMPAFKLTDVDANTISVNPAEMNGEPCVGVGLKGTDEDGEQVTVRFLLQETAGFKIAYTTDNKATGVMRRRAARKPYQLKASEITVRKSRAGNTPSIPGAPKFTPEGHIKALATYAVRASDTEAQACERVADKLHQKKADGTLPYTLTPKLRRFIASAVKSSWENQGTQPGRRSPVKVYKNRRFYA